MAVLSIDLASDLRAPRRARTWLRGLRDEVDPEVFADLELVVSELVTNAVRYGPQTPVRLEVDVRGRRDVRGQVVDNGRPTRKLRIADATGASGGFGLRVIDRVARRWGVDDGSTHVWFELDGARPS